MLTLCNDGASTAGAKQRRIERGYDREWIGIWKRGCCGLF